MRILDSGVGTCAVYLYRPISVLMYHYLGQDQSDTSNAYGWIVPGAGWSICGQIRTADGGS